MTRQELISGLYAHFPEMYAAWRKCTDQWGAGALVFLPTDYEKAGDFRQVQWDFWKHDQLVDFLVHETHSQPVLGKDQEEFLSTVNATQFLSVIIQYDPEKDRQEVEIRRIDRTLLT